jgi:hypothetical protein
MQSKIYHVPSNDHWLRQCDKARASKVYQVIELPRAPEEQPVVIAMTSKSSAQRIIAALTEQGEADRYRVSCFDHPELGLEVNW